MPSHFKSLTFLAKLQVVVAGMPVDPHTSINVLYNILGCILFLLFSEPAADLGKGPQCRRYVRYVGKYLRYHRFKKNSSIPRHTGYIYDNLQTNKSTTW